MHCFVLSRDLMFSSQAATAATTAGCDAKTLGLVEQVQSAEPHLVVLDLTVPGLDISEAVSSLMRNGATVIAVGPHVHEEKLDAARMAGCDHVLSKGQANRELKNLIEDLSKKGIQ